MAGQNVHIAQLQAAMHVGGEVFARRQHTMAVHTLDYAKSSNHAGAVASARYLPSAGAPQYSCTRCRYGDGGIFTMKDS